MGTGAPTLLVTGASGRLGRRAVSLLLEAGVRYVVAASRRPGALADLVARGASARRLDFSDIDSLAPALAGVDRLLLVSTDLVDAPGIRLRQQTRLIDAAVAAGVRHVVYTSITRPGPGSCIPCAIDHHETERHLAASGLAHTVLRNNRYMELLPHLLAPALASGELVTIGAAGACAYVAREDCARVAAAVLSAPPPGDPTLDVTGPAAVGPGELAQTVARVLRRPFGLKVVPEAARRAALAARGFSAARIEQVVSAERAAARGDLALVTDTVERITGRKPQSVGAFLQAHPDLLRSPGDEPPW